MKFFKTLFSIFIISIFLTSCGALEIKEKTPVEIAQEKFINLETQYEELLSFYIELENLKALQKEYEYLSLESHHILFSEYSEIKLNKKEKTILLTLNNSISKRMKILKDLKD